MRDDGDDREGLTSGSFLRGLTIGALIGAVISGSRLLLLGVELNETLPAIREPAELRQRRRETSDGEETPRSARNRSAPHAV